MGLSGAETTLREPGKRGPVFRYRLMHPGFRRKAIIPPALCIPAKKSVSSPPLLPSESLKRRPWSEAASRLSSALQVYPVRISPFTQTGSVEWKSPLRIQPGAVGP